MSGFFSDRKNATGPIRSAYMKIAAAGIKTPMSPFVMTASAQNAKNATVSVPRHTPERLSATIKQNIAADMNAATAMSSVTICPSA